MCNPLVITAITAAAGGLQAYGQYQEGVATNKYYQAAADQQAKQGEYALKAGQKQSELVQDTAKLQGKQQAVKSAEVQGSQRAAMAAMGLSSGSVTGQDVATDTLSKSLLDEMAIRYNADVKSWEIGENAKMENWQSLAQADQYRFAGKSAKRAGGLNAFSTLLGTAGSVGMSGLLSPKIPTNIGPGTTKYGIKAPSRIAFR